MEQVYPRLRIRSRVHTDWRIKLELGALRLPRIQLSPVGTWGAVLLAVFVIAALTAPLVAPYNPLAITLKDSLKLPSWTHPLGTDHLGRDTLSRVLFGARYSLGAAGAVAALVTVIGVAVGTVAGFYGGWIDEIIMRVVDTVLAFPSIILALVIAGLLGPGLRNLILAMIVVRWADFARVVRSQVLSLREQDFVLAARAVGASDWRIMARHLLPNTLGPVIVLTTLDLGKVLLAISGLSFIGLGVQPPAPEWGAMLNYGRSYIQTAPLLMVFPGAAIALVVLAANLLGDALRDLLDPRHNETS